MEENSGRNNNMFKKIHSNEKFNKYYPFLMKNMQNVLERVIKAINNREKIVIFGYYDVDSITSVSILLLTLRYLKADVEYFIPEEVNREKALTEEDIREHIDFLGAKLIISLGCWVNCKEVKDLCNSLNIDVITLSNDICNTNEYGYILSPNECDSLYPFKELSYSGVTFKLVQALAVYYKSNKFNKYIDLAALGTLASGKQIIDENQYIVKEGLGNIKFSKNYGIRALMNIHNIKEINKESMLKLVSTIIPKINPIGNMDNAKIIVELLTTRDKCKAEQIAKYLYPRHILDVYNMDLFNLRRYDP